MKIFGLDTSKIFGKSELDQEDQELVASVDLDDPKIKSTFLFSISYDGEKNPGDLGNVISYDLDYRSLRLRSWESYLTSEITQTVVKRFAMWVIGKGLKLQSEPIQSIISDSGFKPDSSEIRDKIEKRFRLYAESSDVDHSRRKNLHELAKTAYINTIVGGDVLVVLRYYNKDLTVQLIDASSLQTPYNKTGKIKNGIEYNSKGAILAYWVRTENHKFKRIKARNSSSDLEQAFLVTGQEYRLSDNRGIPMFSAVLETLKKLDRYKEATVGSAEERAKVPMYIKHGIASNGENPITAKMARSWDADSSSETDSCLADGATIAKDMSRTLDKTVYNMPIDSTIESVSNKNDIYFKEFYSVNVDIICAAIGIPPEVALSKYDSNFSASRAALKDWEHTLDVSRKDFVKQFYNKIYCYWLNIQVLEQNIQLDGYITALQKKDKITLAAFRSNRFVGSTVPHIDPVKEVMAERAKLGASGVAIPLTTAEAATEAVGGGDFNANMHLYSRELKETIEQDIKPPVKEYREPSPKKDDE